MTQEIDAYRRVLSRFASGVTVVTAYRGQRADGVTVSAFSAVSLEPPLVLACIGEESDCYELLARSDLFGINVLSAEQGPLALAFAQVGDAKTQALRIFPDEAGRMNRSVLDIDGEVLVVSQFTLYGNTDKGNRPSFVDSAPPEQAEPMYEAFVADMAAHLGKPVPTGVFGAMMDVHLVNEGPVTLWVEKRA